MAEQEARQRQTIIYVMADWEYQDYLKRNKYTEAEDEDGGRVFHYVPVMHTNLQEYLVPASCYYGQENIMATYFKGLFGSIRIGFAEVTIRQTGDGKYRNFLARYKYDVGVRARTQSKANVYFTVKGAEEARRRPIETRNIVKDSMSVCVISLKDYALFWEWANENSDKTSVKKVVHDNIKTKSGNKALLGGFILASVESFITSAEHFCQKECSVEQKVPVKYGKLEIRDNQAKVIITDDRYLLMTLLSNTAPDKYSVEEKYNIEKTETMKHVFYVVTDSDYEKLKTYGRNPHLIYYGFETGEVIDAIIIDNYNTRAIRATNFFETVEKGAIPRSNIRYGVVNVDFTRNKQSRITIQAQKDGGEEYIREENNLERALRKKESFTVSNSMTTCVLSDEDYQLLLFDLQCKLLSPSEYMCRENASVEGYYKELNNEREKLVRNGGFPPYHFARHQFISERGKTVLINGFLTKSRKIFYTTQTRFYGAECQNKQKCELRSGKLIEEGWSYRHYKIIDQGEFLPIVRNSSEQEIIRNAWLKEPNEETDKKIDMQIDNQNISFCVPKDRKIILSGKNCHCRKCSSFTNCNTTINCTAKVTTRSGETVPITVQCCLMCGSLYLSYETYKVYDRRYGGLKFRCELDVSDIPKGEQLKLSAQSFLGQNGYSVEEGISIEERHRTLARLIDNTIATKHEIIEKITEIININTGNRHMANAISRWEEDIEFVADYDSNTQLDVGEREIEQKGRITR